MLSTLSPIRARKSMISSGPTPNFSFTPSTSRRLPVMVLTSVMCPSTSCAMSLSPVEITTGRPAAALLRARVPITSSASTLHAQQRQAEGADAGMQRLDLDPQVVGHRRPIGLVLGEQLVAEGRALGVEDHRERVVGYCLRRLRSMFSTPFTAPVGLPVEVVRAAAGHGRRGTGTRNRPPGRGRWLMRGINLFRRPGRRMNPGRFDKGARLPCVR